MRPKSLSHPIHKYLIYPPPRLVKWRIWLVTGTFMPTNSIIMSYFLPLIPYLSMGLTLPDVTNLQINDVALLRFLLIVRDSYRPSNPYHNFRQRSWCFAGNVLFLAQARLAARVSAGRWARLYDPLKFADPNRSAGRFSLSPRVMMWATRVSQTCFWRVQKRHSPRSLTAIVCSSPTTRQHLLRFSSVTGPRRSICPFANWLCSRCSRRTWRAILTTWMRWRGLRPRRSRPRDEQYRMLVCCLLNQMRWHFQCGAPPWYFSAVGTGTVQGVFRGPGGGAGAWTERTLRLATDPIAARLSRCKATFLDILNSNPPRKAGSVGPRPNPFHQNVCQAPVHSSKWAFAPTWLYPCDSRWKRKDLACGWILRGGGGRKGRGPMQIPDKRNTKTCIVFSFGGGNGVKHPLC